MANPNWEAPAWDDPILDDALSEPTHEQRIAAYREMIGPVKPINFSIVLGSTFKKSGSAASVEAALQEAVGQATGALVRSYISTIHANAPTLYEKIAELMRELYINWYMTPYGYGLFSDTVGVWTGSFMQSLFTTVNITEGENYSASKITLDFDEDEPRYERSKKDMHGLLYSVSSGYVGEYGDILFNRMQEKEADVIYKDMEMAVRDMVEEWTKKYTMHPASTWRFGPRSDIQRLIDRYKAANLNMIEIAAAKRLAAYMHGQKDLFEEKEEIPF